MSLRKRFIVAWNDLHRELARPPFSFLLPAELAAEWMARWAVELTLGGFRSYDGLTPDEVVAEVGNLATLEAAV